MDQDDDFGLSSGDESDLAALCNEIDPSPISTKRKHSTQSDCVGPPVKRLATDQNYSTKSPLAVKVLNEQFGLKQFRLEQEAVIARILEGGSAVVVFPTGGGKSLCYQVPAVAFSVLDKQANVSSSADSGVTIVVSPLIALMKDQVDSLVRRNIKAACLDSTKSRAEFLQINDELQAGRLKLLYCAPERLNNEGFTQSIKSVRGGVRLVAIDEAHCISEWGHAFRPDYLKVARFVSEIKAERVICLTATATLKVAQDICDAFGVDEGGLFRTTMYRSNLRLLVEATKTKQQKYPKLFKFLTEHPGPTIIYVTLQKQSELLAKDLQDQGFDSKAFHAGMQTDTKTSVQEEFMVKDNMVIVATIAFGMGIDKANIRNVIHFDIPRSVEGYSQQIGRAGRDGLQSICLFYLCPEDFYLQENFTYGDLPSKESVHRLLKDICSPVNVRLEVGETFTTSHYSQSKEFDIRGATLGILYAQLELQFGLIRAITPKYSSYSYEAASNYYNYVPADRTPAARAIQKFARKAAKYYHIDVDAASRVAGVLRADIIRKLNDWNEKDIILLKTSGVQHVYHVLQKLPSTSQEIEDMVDKLYAQMQAREQQDLQRTRDVVSLSTSSTCLSYKLAAYFGDSSRDMQAECGHCTWCETHNAVVLKKMPPVETDHNAIGAVLRACSARDDPRFLARIAFGITSPRVTEMKLSKDPVFGSLNTHDFMELVRIFTAVCRNAPSASYATKATAKPALTKTAPAKIPPTYEPRGGSVRYRGT